MAEPLWPQESKPRGYWLPARAGDGQTLLVVERYATLQMEGARAGTPAFFIRLQRCNLRCVGCDTQFDEGEAVPVAALAEEAAASGCGWAVLTGGEPALQLLDGAVDALHARGVRVAVETNGTQPLPAGLDWVTVSPKALPTRVRAGSELKVVCAADLTDAALDLMEGPEYDFPHRFLQPLWGDADGAARAVAWVRRRPRWRLSIQGHKYLGLR